MRRWCATLLLLCAAGEASALARGAFSVEPGYRHDTFEWNIAGPGGQPDILSELKWKDMHIAQLRAGGAVEFDSGLRLQASVAYGRIVSGENRDSDFLADGRNLEFSRSDNDAGGRVREASVAAGWVVGEQGRLRADGGGTSYFVPMLGYAWRGIDLRMTDGHQSIPPTGDFPGLDSRYDARWQGPWIGIEYVDRVPEDLYGFLRLEYHRPRFSAEADWNLREDFRHPVSFAHDADGDGYVVTLGFHTPPQRNRFSWRLVLDYQWWRTDAGRDRTFFSDGSQGELRLNKVRWDSWSIHYGIQFDF